MKALAAALRAAPVERLESTAVHHLPVYRDVLVSRNLEQKLFDEYKFGVSLNEHGELFHPFVRPGNSCL